MKLFLPLLLLCSLSSAYGQTITFSDLWLKHYLVTKLCVDTNDDGIYDATADSNQDQKIQVSEAESILSLRIGKFPDTSHITSVQDLRHFKHLQSLTLHQLLTVREVSHLGLDSLKRFFMNDCLGTKVIDISDLPRLEEVFITGIVDLDYLNLKNGSSPTGLFSLFYCIDIRYACVDSSLKEYAEVAMHMAAGLTPSLDCRGTAVDELKGLDVKVFPSPTTGSITIEAEDRVQSLKIYDLSGRLCFRREGPIHSVDISHLPTGLYHLRLTLADQVIYKKLIKE